MFWDPACIADKAILSTKKSQQELLLRAVMDKFHEVRSLENEDQIALSHPRSPLVMGDFTNWKPIPLIDVLDYTEGISEQFDCDRVI